MISKGKLPFDPKVFLSKVNGGRAISNYRKDQSVYTQGEPADSVFYIQSGRVRKTVISEQGKEAVVALLGTGDFFGEGCLTGQLLRLATVFRYDGMRDHANSKARHHPHHPQRAGVCRIIYRAPFGPQQPRRGGLGRSIVQFERETAGTDPSALGEFWQRRSAGANPSENQPRDTGGDDRHDAIAREFFHEQISRIGSY
jgi:hypothetical protein